MMLPETHYIQNAYINLLMQVNKLSEYKEDVLIQKEDRNHFLTLQMEILVFHQSILIM
jgi:hypothetical protein